ncbi:MAG: hypothetical protein P1U34_04300 [Coxiellaceae bacterium]|nr:hypothetical protein [Coxiellaceae bacterium]
MSNAAEWLDKLERIRPVVQARASEVKVEIDEAKVPVETGPGGGVSVADLNQRLLQLKGQLLQVVDLIKQYQHLADEDADLTPGDIDSLEVLFGSLQTDGIELPSESPSPAMF